MNNPRETIEVALFDLLKDYVQQNYQSYEFVPEFVDFSRQYRPVEKDSSDQQPVLYLVKGPEHVDQDDVFGPSRFKLHYAVVIFLQLDPMSKHPLPQTVLNNIVQMVEDSLFNRGDAQTLGRLVTNAWIEGDIEI